MKCCLFLCTCSFCLGLGLGMWTLHVSPGAVSSACKREQTLSLFGVQQSYWNSHVWNRKEALFLSSVSRWLRHSIVFTSDLKYFVLLSSVSCIGTFFVSVVSGSTRLSSSLLRLVGAASGAGRSMLLADHYRGGNHEICRITDDSDNENLWLL